MSNKKSRQGQDTFDNKPGVGVKADFNSFLHHFTQKNTLRYEDFAELWKELYMPYIFAGRDECELKEALTYAFETATEMFNTATYVQAKTCAIYLLYAVYETQALYPKMKIRVTVAQYKEFSSFVEERAKHSDYDFVFVFSRLRMERAFHYVATAQQMGKLKWKQTATAKIKETTPTSIVSTFADVSLDLLDELAIINEQYYSVKCETTNPGQSVPHPSVDLAKPDFIRDVTGVLAKFDNWRKTGQWNRKGRRPRAPYLSGGLTTSESEGDNASDSDSAVERHEETIAEKRAKIREKAYGNVSDASRSSRYRRMVAEAEPDTEEAGTSGVSEPRRRGGHGGKQKPTLKGPFKPLDKDQQEILDRINAHLKQATAPSRKEMRRRRYNQGVAKKKLEKAKQQVKANQESSSDAEG